MANFHAFYDSLKIVSRVGETVGEIGRYEIQRVSYLGCLLSLYKKQATSDWGYRFVTTHWGAPFSDVLDHEIEGHVNNNLLIRVGNGLKISNSGKVVLDQIDQLKNFNKREVFLRPACDSLMAVPPFVLRRGLSMEPTVQSSFNTRNGSLLLEGSAVRLLHENFQELREALGDTAENLLQPSVVWLTFMAELGEEGETYEA